MNNKTSVLLVDDEKAIRNFMSASLSTEGYRIIQADCGNEAISLAGSYNPELIILDLGLPDMDGLEVLKKIRETSSVPIVIVSARGCEDEKVKALDLGADDYVTKPFSMEELAMRIEAVLRRCGGRSNKYMLYYRIGKYLFDTQKQTIAIDDQVTRLTTKENELLALLCANANETLERNYALKTIWADDNYFNARSMDVYVTKLRKLLKSDPEIEIKNIHGKGYKLVTPLKEKEKELCEELIKEV